MIQFSKSSFCKKCRGFNNNKDIQINSWIQFIVEALIFLGLLGIMDTLTRLLSVYYLKVSLYFIILWYFYVRLLERYVFWLWPRCTNVKISKTNFTSTLKVFLLEIFVPAIKHYRPIKWQEYSWNGKGYNLLMMAWAHIGMIKIKKFSKGFTYL